MSWTSTRPPPAMNRGAVVRRRFMLGLRRVPHDASLDGLNREGGCVDQREFVPIVDAVAKPNPVRGSQVLPANWLPLTHIGDEHTYRTYLFYTF